MNIQCDSDPSFTLKQVRSLYHFFLFATRKFNLLRNQNGDLSMIPLSRGWHGRWLAGAKFVMPRPAPNFARSKIAPNRANMNWIEIPPAKPISPIRSARPRGNRSATEATMVG